MKLEVDNTLAAQFLDATGHDRVSRVSSYDDRYEYQLKIPERIIVNKMKNMGNIIYAGSRSIEIPLFEYNGYEDFNLSAINFIKYIKRSSSDTSFMGMNVEPELLSEEISTSTFLQIRDIIDTRFKSRQTDSCPMIILSNCHSEQIAKISDIVDYEDNIRGSYIEGLHILIAEDYPENSIDVVDWVRGMTVYNESRTKFGLALRFDDKASFLAFELNIRSSCNWCNNSREGIRWNAETKMMDTIQEGCSHCGKNPV